MSFEITGTLVKKYETETKGESFRVRDFVIKANDGGQYDNFVKFQCTQDRTTIVDDLNVQLEDLISDVVIESLIIDDYPRPGDELVISLTNPIFQELSPL